MTTNIELWLNNNKVGYKTQRNKVSQAIIDLDCTYKDWDKLSENYHKIKETKFGLEERMLMSFIFCALKQLPLTKEMLYSENDNDLAPEQRSALSLFIEDEYEDDVVEDEDDDNALLEVEGSYESASDLANMLDFINDEIKRTEYQNNYYYLLKKIKHQIQDLDLEIKNIDDNTEEDDLLSHSSQRSQVSTAASNKAPVLDEIIKKGNIDPDSFAIKISTIDIDDPDNAQFTGWTLLKNAANYVMDGIWSWFSWSNDYVIKHFFDKKVTVYNNEKQVVKDEFQNYLDQVDGLWNNIQKFNQASHADSLQDSLDIIIKTHQNIEEQKLKINQAIEKSKKSFVLNFFNENLIAFYNDIQAGLLENKTFIDQAKLNVTKETNRINSYYQPLIEIIDVKSIDEQAIAQGVDYLMLLINKEVIYKDLPELINKSSDQIKRNCLDIVKIAVEKLIESQLKCNISTYAQNKPKLDVLLNIAKEINYQYKNFQNISNLLEPVIAKVEKTKIHLQEMTALLEKLQDNKPVNMVALAIHLLVVSKHAPSTDFPDFDILERLYKEKNWWPNFAAIHNILLESFADDKRSIQDVITFLNIFAGNEDYIKYLKNACDVLQQDYPNTAPVYNDKLSLMIAQKYESQSVGRYASGGGWTPLPPSKTVVPSASNATLSLVF